MCFEVFEGQYSSFCFFIGNHRSHNVLISLDRLADTTHSLPPTSITCPPGWYTSKRVCTESTQTQVKVSSCFLRESDLAESSLLRTLYSLEVSILPYSSSQYVLKESRFKRFTSLLYSHGEFLKFNQPSFSLLVQAQSG